jgi:hypothetical protein
MLLVLFSIADSVLPAAFSILSLRSTAFEPRVAAFTVIVSPIVL